MTIIESNRKVNCELFNTKTYIYDFCMANKRPISENVSINTNRNISKVLAIKMLINSPIVKRVFFVLI